MSMTRITYTVCIHGWIGRYLWSLIATVFQNDQGRSQGWAWGAEAPPPNEFQPMKYPGLAKSAQMYGVIGLIAGNIPTYR